MKSIIIMSYAVSPTRGSEYSVGWNYLLEISKNNIVHLICGTSGDHMGDTNEIEEYMKDNTLKNVYLYIVKPSQFTEYINKFNKKGFGPAFYIAFKLWHKSAFKVAEKIISENNIDLVHQYNPIGFREPGYLWKLNKPFIWGPIGGANFVNLKLLKNKPIKIKLFYLVKNFATFLQLNFSTRVKKASQKAEKLIFCNTENKKNFEKFLGKSGLVISEQAVPIIDIKVDDFIFNKNSDYLRIVHIGRLDEGKNTQFLLESLSLVKSKQWKLNIIGKGSIEDKLIQLSIKLNINENIVWNGFKSRDEIFEILKESDINALTSLSEANTTVLYEARLFGIPTISLDQNGMHDTLANGNGILVNVKSYEETRESYAKKIEELIENRGILDDLKEKTIELAKISTWSEKIKMYEEIYSQVMSTK